MAVFDETLSNIVITGTEEADSIKSSGSNVTIDADDGKDTIDNSGNEVVIDASYGVDSIKNSGTQVSVSGGNSGDGDDTIDGFNETSRLRIGDGKTDTYATLESGNDVIVYVGTGTILLTGAAALEERSITGVENELPSWRHSGTTATFGTSTETLITVNGVKSLNGISHSGNVVTVSASALNQETVTISDGYTLNIADDVPVPQTIVAAWSHSGTTATYKNDSISAGYTLANNQIVYSLDSGGEAVVSVNGVKSANGISLSGTTVTVSNSALNQGTVTVNNGYTLVLGSNVTQPATTAANWSLSGTTATYKNASTSAGYKLANNQISYVTASGGDTLVNVSGVKATGGLAIDTTNNKVTVSNAALNQGTVTVNNGYSLVLGSDVTQTATTAAGWNLSGTTATYKNASTSAGYSLDNNQIVYIPNSGGENLVTISGIKSTDGLAIDTANKKVTVSATSLNQTNVTISNGYILERGSDVVQTKTTTAGWAPISGNTATYKNAHISAGYKLENNQISYVAESGGENLVTVNGVNSTSGLTINTTNKKVTVSNASLNQNKVTISNGYTLELATDVTQTKTTAADWTFKDSAATYNLTSTSAGYKLENNQISYVAASGGQTAVKVSGVKSKDGLTIDTANKKVTVTAKALGTSKVTINNGYTLALAAGVQKPSTSKAWVYKDSTATYRQTKTAGYTLADNKKSISYSAKSTKDFVTVSGVKSKNGLTINTTKKQVTVAAAALNKKKVTVDNGYTLALAKKVAKSSTEKAAWSLNKSKSTATYKGSYKTAGYTLASDKKSVSYVEGTTAKTSATVKGAAATKGLSLVSLGNNSSVTGGKGKVTSYSDKNGEHTYLAKSDRAIADSTVILLKNYKGDSFSATDTIRGVDASAVQLNVKITGNKFMNNILGGSGNDTLNGGTGNDTLTGGAGADVFVYGKNGGDDVITDYAIEDKIHIQSAKVSNVKTSNTDVILTVGNGKITVKGGKGKLITYVDSTGINYYPEATDKNVVVQGDTVNLLKNYTEETFNANNNIKTINASPVSQDLIITGNSGANVILGGFGHDTIIGGKNNDTLYGGDGDDVFVYDNGDGNDLIVDYGAGDKISLASGSVKSSAVKGDDYIFTVGANKITIKNGANKSITVADKNGTEKIYNQQGDVAWFLEDDNNFTADNELSELIEEKTYLPAAQVDTSTDLFKENNFVTYSKK